MDTLLDKLKMASITQTTITLSGKDCARILACIQGLEQYCDDRRLEQAKNLIESLDK